MSEGQGSLTFSASSSSIPADDPVATDCRNPPSRVCCAGAAANQMPGGHGGQVRMKQHVHRPADSKQLAMETSCLSIASKSSTVRPDPRRMAWVSARREQFLSTYISPYGVETNKRGTAQGRPKRTDSATKNKGILGAWAMARAAERPPDMALAPNCASIMAANDLW